MSDRLPSPFNRAPLAERIAQAKNHMHGYRQHNDALWPHQPFSMTMGELVEAAEAGLKADAEIKRLRAALAAQQAPQAKPVAWLREDWSGTGQRHMSFDGPPNPKPVRDEVVNPIWTPLYAAPAAPAGWQAPADTLTLMQAGFNNAELLMQWRKKLPGVEPSDRELSAFAVGTEVGWQRAMLAAAPTHTPAAPAGWQPIETAPKDTQIILAAEFDGPGDWRIKTGYYSTEMGLWRVWGASWAPTHWMPLPAAPTHTQEVK